MSSSLSFATVTLIATPLTIPALVFFFLTTFRAVRIQRALLVPIYRRQAQWIGASGAYWVATFASFGGATALEYLPGGTIAFGSAISIALFALLYFGLVFTFAWVDIMAGISRNSDPRNRDILRWRYLRFLLWGAILAGIAWGAYSVGPSVLAQGGPPTENFVVFYAANPIFFFTSGAGALVLAVGSFQSNDPTLRKQLKWMGAYVLLLFVNIVDAVYFVGISGQLPRAFDSTAFLAASAIIDLGLAISLFQASRSLVSLNRFSQE